MWEIKKVSRIGNGVAVKYINKKDDNTTEEKELTWSYDEQFFETFDTFLEMVKREAKIMLNHMNSQERDEDITEEFI